MFETTFSVKISHKTKIDPDRLAGILNALIADGMLTAQSTIDDAEFNNESEINIQNAEIATSLDIGAFKETTNNRCLVIVSGGVAETISDETVNAVIFDMDNYKDDPDNTEKVPANFSDLAAQYGATLPCYEAINKNHDNAELEFKIKPFALHSSNFFTANQSNIIIELGMPGHQPAFVFEDKHGYYNVYKSVQAMISNNHDESRLASVQANEDLDEANNSDMDKLDLWLIENHSKFERVFEDKVSPFFHSEPFSILDVESDMTIKGKLHLISLHDGVHFIFQIEESGFIYDFIDLEHLSEMVLEEAKIFASLEEYLEKIQDTLILNNVPL